MTNHGVQKSKVIDIVGDIAENSCINRACMTSTEGHPLYNNDNDSSNVKWGKSGR